MGKEKYGKGEVWRKKMYEGWRGMEEEEVCGRRGMEEGGMEK